MKIRLKLENKDTAQINLGLDMDGNVLNIKRVSIQRYYVGNSI